MKQWSKTPYGADWIDGKWVTTPGRWAVTNGHITFDVHVLFDASSRKEQYPDGVIVSPAQADEYARQIVDALNAANVVLPPVDDIEAEEQMEAEHFREALDSIDPTMGELQWSIALASTDGTLYWDADNEQWGVPAAATTYTWAQRKTHGDPVLGEWVRAFVMESVQVPRDGSYLGDPD